MSIAIVCMINNTALSGTSHKQENITEIFKPNDTTNAQCAGSVAHHKSIVFFKSIFFINIYLIFNFYLKDGPFVISKSIQGFVLSSYFYGYILTQVI